MLSPKGRSDLSPAQHVEIRDIFLRNRKEESRSEQDDRVQKLFVVTFPSEHLKTAMAFWRLSGLGISSRLAQKALDCLPTHHAGKGAKDSLDEIWTDAHQKICERIGSLLRRASIDPARAQLWTCSDVYLYPSGMSAIYHTHHNLLKWRGSQSIVFGFPYELTLKMLETFGAGCTFFPFGTESELDLLEAFLKEQKSNGAVPQAIWCECPSNPLLRTPNLARVKRLANEIDIPVVIDETIGSFANVDLSGVADVIVTSLTKSFSGYSNVMAGSVALNPASRFCLELRALFSESYHNALFAEDAIELELNSRDFLNRAARINETTLELVNYFHSLSTQPKSCITAVYHPSKCWSIQNYEACMRHATKDFKPGYGGLFTLQFDSIMTARTFFDNAAVHKGPSLGANVTLLQPYVQTVFFREKEWAANNGVQETIVRVSVGLEDKGELLEAFKIAMAAADGIR